MLFRHFVARHSGKRMCGISGATGLLALRALFYADIIGGGRMVVVCGNKCCLAIQPFVAVWYILLCRYILVVIQPHFELSALFLRWVHSTCDEVHCPAILKMFNS